MIAPNVMNTDTENLFAQVPLVPFNRQRQTPLHIKYLR